MKLFVTGASGFLGTALAQRLRTAGHDVTGISSKTCDLTLPSSLRQFDETPFDLIIHLAAWTQAGDFCLHHSGEQWVINQQMNTNLLEWWISRQPHAKLVTMGTSCSYSPELALREENYLAGTPIDSLFTYAMTKRMLYVGLLAAAKQYGLKHLTLIPSTLYGPDYHTDGRQMHFVFDLIRKILRGKYQGKGVVLWGTGHQKRELVHVQDFISALISLLPLDNELINVGAGKEYSIREFAALISDIVGYDNHQIRFDESRYTGAASKCLDITKLKQLIPEWAPTDLRSGLEGTIAWFLKDEARWS